MSKFAILLTSKFAQQKYSGANLRLDLIEQLLRESGYEVIICDLMELREIRNSGRNFEIGVAVSFVNIRSIPHLKKVSKIVWLDSVDSIFHTRLLGLGRSRIIALIKGLLEIIFAFYIGRKVNYVTYISEKDRRWDRHIFKNASKYVIPNKQITLKRMESEHPREIFFVGDLAYNANRRALKRFLKIACAVGAKTKANFIVVTGSTKSKNVNITLSNGGEIKFMDSLPIERIYHSKSIHLVPIWNSVGIKNKVFEPSSLGLPVFAGIGAFNGLRIFPHMISASNSSELTKHLVNYLSVDDPFQPNMFNVIEKNEVAELMISLGNSLDKMK